jgi:acyl-CoA synthetase (AMP-forming)/AMP-acid ligase II
VFIDDVLANAARESPDAPALVFGDDAMSFAELERRAARLAAALQGSAAPGDRVAVLAENHPAVVDCYYAVPRAGMILVLLNYRLAGAELLAMLRDSGARLLIGERSLIDRVRAAAGDGDMPAAIAIDAAAGGEQDWDDLLAGGGEPAPVERAAGDTAWLIYTSGTTGRPKGAMLSHANLIAGLLATSLGRPVRRTDVYLYPFPLCHVSGYNVCVHHLHRRPVVLLRRFAPAAVLEAVRKHRVTTMSLAPTMIAMLLDDAGLGAADLSSLRSIGYGASAIPPAVLRRGMELLGCDFAQGYGMTELAGNAVFLDAAAHRRGLAGEPHLLAAAGRPGPLIGLRIVGDDGADVAAGEVGEIVVRGPQVTAGYWRDAAATAACLRDGWFHTGDVGRRDAEGFLYVVDRKKDIIVTGGENVSSREVEDVLHLHPAVREAAVVGEPDPRWGENVCAFVALRAGAAATEAELVELVRRHLASYKKPKHVLFVDELPKNASGKVVKAELRARRRRRFPDRDGETPV